MPIETRDYNDFTVVIKLADLPLTARGRVKKWLKPSMVTVIVQIHEDVDFSADMLQWLAESFNDRFGDGMVVKVGGIDDFGLWSITLQLWPKALKTGALDEICNSVEFAVDAYDADMLGGLGDDLVYGPSD
jgi:hypothetical protein